MSVGKLAEQVERLLAEGERRLRDTWLERYDPTQKRGAQNLLVQSPARKRVFLGPNGCGKTTVGLAIAHAWALGYQPWDGSTKNIPVPPNDILVCCRDFTHTAMEDVIPKIDTMLPRKHIKRVERVNGRPHKWVLNNNSTIKIMTYEQDAWMYEGPQYHLAILNEPPPYRIMSGIERGVAKNNGTMIFAFTPLGVESAWIHDEIVSRAGSDPDVCVVWADDIDQDSFMTKDAIAEFKKSIDPMEAKARLHGQFQHLEGLIYTTFNPAVHFLKSDQWERVQPLIQDKTVPKGMIVDPHDRRPFAMGWFLVTPTNDIVWFAEWPTFEYHKAKTCDVSLPGYVDIIRQMEEGFADSVAWRVIDPNSGPKRNVITGESIVEALAGADLFFDHSVNDDLQAGHVQVREFLEYDPEKPLGVGNRPRMYFAPGLHNFAYAMSRYAWKELRGDSRAMSEKPAEIGKDFADLVRYGAMTNPQYFNPAEMYDGPPPPDLYRGAL